MKTHTIWTSDINLKDWEDYFEECFEEEEREDLDEYEKYRIVEDINATYLEDERMNLNVELGREIIAIGDLGLWNGRVTGYKEIGTNIADCLYSEYEYQTWYIDHLGDFRLDETHHDGTNFVLYRVFKEGITEEQKENFKWKVYKNKATRKDITRYTERLGDAIAKVYGFTIRKKAKRRVA